MEAQWMSEDFAYERWIMAGDAGGTNMTLALMGERESNFTIVAKFPFLSAEIDGVMEPMREALDAIEARDPALRPTMCCITAAGPIEKNYCKLSNVPWDIDGNAIEETYGMKTLLVNDFAGISYSLPMLDVHNPESITPLTHLDGSPPKRAEEGRICAVVGAGSGLGVGRLVDIGDGRYYAPPSEGGHVSLAGFDEETREFENYMAETRVGHMMEAELFVSGPGIASIFHYFKDVKKVAISGALAEIDALPDKKKPKAISAAAQHPENPDPVCGDIMRFFVKFYGKCAGDLSAVFMPTRGMFLAGGIVTKNERFFVEDNLFMQHFERCYHPNIQRVLKTMPVYIIKDYAVSLYGAANAARSAFG